MITKAGAPSNRIAVGVSSYGRSFRMTTPGCSGPMCTYTGPSSGATPGECTGTAGYISNGEIKQIIQCNPTAALTKDNAGGNILTYNGDQWVSYMDDITKASRTAQYKSLNFLGTTDWAISLDSDPYTGATQDMTDSDSYLELDTLTPNNIGADLGLGGLIATVPKVALGKGAVQPVRDASCKKHETLIKSGWADAGKIVKMAKNPREYDRSLQNAHSWVCQAIILSKTIIFTRFLDPRCSFNVDDAKMERNRRADAEGHAGKRRGTERSSWPRGYNNARLRQRP